MASIKKNYIYQVLYQILTLLMPLITAPYITRTLGSENLGIYSYGVSIANIFISIAGLGIASQGCRAIAMASKDRKKRSEVFWSIYAIQFTAAAVMLICYYIYVGIFVHADKQIYVILGIMVGAPILDITWLYMGMENFKKTVLRNTFVKILSFVLILTLVKNRSDLWIYTSIMTCCIVVGHLTLWKDVARCVDFVRVGWPAIRFQLRPVLILFIPSIAVMIYTVMDSVMLGAISGTIQVGYYEYASAIVSIPLGFITSFGAVMLPRLSAMVAEGSEEETQIKIKQQSLIFTAAISAAMTFGLAAVSPDLIPIYYGEEFLPCIAIMSLISFKLPFMAWANVIRSECLIPHNKDYQFIISLFSGAILNFIINLLLIPRSGASGAAVGTIAAEACVCIVQTWFARGDFHVAKTMQQCVPFGIIAFIMFFIVRCFSRGWTGNPISGLVCEILIGMVSYMIPAFLSYSLIIERVSPIVFLKRLFDK